MFFYDYIWKDFPDTARSTGEYIIFHQGGPIDHCAHVTGTVDKYSAESEYSVECTTRIHLSHFRMTNNYFMNKDTYVVPGKAPLIILYSKSAVCMAETGKDTNKKDTFPEECNL